MQTVIRTLKLKSPTQIAASDNHCRRLSKVNNADPDRRHLNFEFVSGGTEETIFKKGKSLLERMAALESQREIKTPRKDSVKLIEVLIAAPPGLFVSPEKQVENGRLTPQMYKWCESNYRFLQRNFTDGKHYTNVIGMQVHLDETTPHIHAWVMPTQDLKYNCKHYLGGSVKMQQLQDNYHAHMQQWMPEVAWERGQKKEITGKSHQTVKNWYKKLAKIEQLGLSEKVEEFIEKTLQEAEKGPQIETHEIVSNLNRQAAQVESGVFEPKDKHVRYLNEGIADLFRKTKGRLNPVSETLSKYKPGSPRSEYLDDFKKEFGTDAAEYAQQHLERLAMLPIDGLRQERERLRDLGYDIGKKPHTGVGSH